MSHPLLLLRADASVEIGTGHILRLLALAQAWVATGAPVVLATTDCPPALAARLAQEGVEIVSLQREDDSAELLRLIEKRKPAWIAWDGFQFRPEYFLATESAAVRGLLIEDFPRAHALPIDLVLNYNFAARASDYPQVRQHAEFHLGPGSFLLRKEFWPHRNARRAVRSAATRVLVTLGGADADNVTEKVLEEMANASLPALEIVVVLGAANPHETAIRAAAARSPHHVRIERNVSDMPALMDWADLAISAAGITAWELVFMQLPTLLLLTAENQMNNARTLSAAGVALFVDVERSTFQEALAQLVGSYEQRAKMAAACAQIIDGEGVFRLRDAMLRRCGQEVEMPDREPVTIHR
jgi:UDP-2,4-diacetamido-2,4,6-trideoxy-beta-L-altropyranose hydrolase